ncbi:Imm10 family immunity protein [Streptomyces sp. NPDC059708]|uniref:Imm10 family immunity protein n=1 Tax=Streptomyces sp. NPDC059708 TaxID=3346916 RepID=UPI0036A0F1C4
MTFRFVARVAGAEIDPDGYFVEAGVAERGNGTGFVLMFQHGEDEPDKQEVALGFDTHCLVTADQGTAYGCVREVALTGNVLRVCLDPSSLAALGLQDAEIEATLDAPAEDVARFREVLPQVLEYGRPDARPVRIGI